MRDSPGTVDHNRLPEPIPLSSLWQRPCTANSSALLPRRVYYEACWEHISTGRLFLIVNNRFSFSLSQVVPSFQPSAHWPAAWHQPKVNRSVRFAGCFSLHHLMYNDISGLLNTANLDQKSSSSMLLLQVISYQTGMRNKLLKPALAGTNETLHWVVSF
jgi:hypothetical protein